MQVYNEVLQMKVSIYKLCK